MKLIRPGGFALIPLPHIEESLEFIRNTQTEELKPDGFAVATSQGHKFLGDSSFDPVWTELNELSATVFVHPGDTNMPKRLDYPPCE